MSEALLQNQQQQANLALRSLSRLTMNENVLNVSIIFFSMQGIICSEQCQRGFYGKDCSLKCNCTNSPCHHATGTCLCLDGYIGERCFLFLYVKRNMSKILNKIDPRVLMKTNFLLLQGVNTNVRTTPTDRSVFFSVTASTTAHVQLILDNAIVQRGLKGKDVNIRVHQGHQGKIVM